MSINSNIKLVNEILNVSNNLKETILKKEISNSKLIELEFGLNESLNILKKLDIGLMNENNMNDKESKFLASGKMVIRYIWFFFLLYPCEHIYLINLHIKLQIITSRFLILKI